ncbi:cation resistant determinant protein C [Rhodopirellula maiorica SM1]|uniref:Cation resistant determinant protein C n=1 Tax=Rhodopirellula maiorica SM1 TaxID=1265738 RepID=M5R7E6_9BACT|nr:cation resistant determinant protein C [Rhodopirellula maiorica SM1]
MGAPIPVFNRNQGNIAAARAELVRACQDALRIENAIKARLAAVSRDYDSSLAAVSKYGNDILPNAADGLRLAETAYKAGETSFVQVLVARRTYFDTNLQFIASQAQLAQARARVDGYVLSGALEAMVDNSGDDSLRGLTFSQQ